MKVLVILLTFVSVTAFAQDAKKAVKVNKQVVEASCGMCKFAMKGSKCELAVKIDGKAYYVDGTKIDEHGDAHAHDGLCESVKKAEVSGKVVDGRFKATHFKLVAENKKKPKELKHK